MHEIFENKDILITGGTGYLGQALTEEILKCNPKSVRIFSRDEVKHHKFQEKFNYNKKIRNLIGDVRDLPRLNRAAKDCDILIHAAALKRLDILEYNVDESIKTNIIGTANVVHTCLENNVSRAIFVSTDKACSPVNSYGACKFVGERIFIESNFSRGRSKTTFSVVRYGNVLESTGSVIPFFNMKIKNGDNIPLTDKRMTRFIITPKEAVDLVFKAIKYGIGGDIFIPKLPSFRIIDLIDILKEKNHANNKVEVVGIRPGEKIHELMINISEIPRTYDFGDLYVIGSHIQEVKDQIIQPEYSKDRAPLSESIMTEYSSKDSLISKDEVKAIFHNIGIL